MTISIIAAVGKNNELGRNNDLIWHFKEDMKFFKNTTMGSCVIMGRKTFESLPKALPGRQNIVITSNPHYKAKDAELASSLEGAINSAGTDNIFIIGGASVYKEALPLCDRLYLTEIDAECSDADVYFPDFDKSKYVSKKLSDFNVNGVYFSHVLYMKKGI